MMISNGSPPAGEPFVVKAGEAGLHGGFAAP